MRPLSPAARPALLGAAAVLAFSGSLPVTTVRAASAHVVPAQNGPALIATATEIGASTTPVLGSSMSQESTPSVGVGPFAQGALVSLKGTPHLWVADSQGTLHWLAGGRAAAGREVNWASRTEVTAEQLVSLPRGEAWLAAPLVKIGEPIYVPHWESPDGEPTLLRVGSPADLQLLGGTGPGSSVPILDAPAWEQSQGIRLSNLPRGELAPVGSPSTSGWAPSTSAKGGFGVWAPAFTLPAPSPRPPLPPLPPLPPAEEGLEMPPGPLAPFGAGLSILTGLSGFGGPATAAQTEPEIHVISFGGFFDGAGALFLAFSATLPEVAQRQIQLLGQDAAYELIRAEAVKSERIALLAYRSTTQGIHRGREVSFEPRLPADDPFLELPEFRPLAEAARAMPTMTITMRVYIVGEKIYTAAVLTSPAANPVGPVAASTDVARFLDSFRFLPS